MIKNDKEVLKIENVQNPGKMKMAKYKTAKVSNFVFFQNVSYFFQK